MSNLDGMGLVLISKKFGVSYLLSGTVGRITQILLLTYTVFIQRGWIQQWKSRIFSPLSMIQFSCELILESWGYLEVVVEHVVAPKEIILNGLMAHAHISG